tara:strand:- start:806 stop:2203 length:1398 start_codon:yes stop_codon:yes gene_type:complete
MSYTTIDDPTIYFNTKLYSGNGGTQSITGVGFQPDWVWLKDRTAANSNKLYDGVRGATKYLISDDNSAEATQSNGLTSFDSDGFTLGSYGGTNNSSNNYVSWNWLAGGTAPAITYSVKVVSDSGNKYRFDDFGTSAVTLDLQEGGTYTFDQSDSSNSGHPLRFSTTSNGTHGGGSEYTTGVTTNGTPGSSGAYTRITVAASAPTLYYYCTQHSGMGGQANTNSTFGSSNFGGSIQTNVSANTTTGFSIVSYTGTGSNATIGHGLGAIPKMYIARNITDAEQWTTYHVGLDASAPEDYHVRLNTTDARVDEAAVWNDTAPTSSVFSVGDSGAPNGSGDSHIAYCFAEVKGFSKLGSYIGNGNGEGTFVYTGFKPAWIMIKRSSHSGTSWEIRDNKRQPFPDGNAKRLFADDSSAESSNNEAVEKLSNGFKIRSTGGGHNTSGNTYIYMAFAESPFVNSNGIPTNAR